MSHWPRHGRIAGPIVMIGFGSIGKGTLPLIERHFEFDQERFVVIDPNDADRKLLDERGVRFVHLGLTRENYPDALKKYLTAGEGQGFCVNLSVDTSSLDLMRYCRELGPSTSTPSSSRGRASTTTSRSARKRAPTMRCARRVMEERRKNPGGPTAVSCCGANPGMVSWFVKQALVNLAHDLGDKGPEPKTKDEWGRLAHRLGVKGVHVAERDTQRAKSPKPRNVFVNTWSVEGFLSEGMQPAELGWGTHEKWTPANAGFHKSGSRAAIYPQPARGQHPRAFMDPDRAGAVRLPRHPQRVDLDRRLLHRARRERRGGLSADLPLRLSPMRRRGAELHEFFGRAGEIQSAHHILGEAEILDGVDELGVLLYGHARNAYWYGSQLSVEETRALAPYQNATGMQVTSAVLAGMVWALENPNAGIVEADEMDFRRCLEIQSPYLGPVIGAYTDGRRSRVAPGSSPRISTRATPGSSATFWCDSSGDGGGLSADPGRRLR